MSIEKNFEYFIVTPGTQAYRDYLALRHKVFCEELKRIPSSNQFSCDIPLECDDYDAYSLHVLCRSLETGAAVGCSRMILPNAKGLSIVSRYTISRQTDVSLNHVGELSRLAIASELRRYRGEPSQQESLQRSRLSNAQDRQYGSLVAMGLYRENFKLAHKYGITHFFAAMEPSLARLLVRIGFPFQKAGPLNMRVKPARQPYLIGVHAIRAPMPVLPLVEPTPIVNKAPPIWIPNLLPTGQLERSGQYPVFSQ